MSDKRTPLTDEQRAIGEENNLLRELVKTKSIRDILSRIQGVIQYKLCKEKLNSREMTDFKSDYNLLTHLQDECE